jgi:AcrR family transcriptional regulator
MSNEVIPDRERVYRKRKRAEQELATRERIIEAAVALHQTLGPARTTVKAIAELAGVQRGTVYRHFPDAATLFGACSASYSARHPAPDAAAWAAIAAPETRLRRALSELYAWYSEVEAMLSKVIRDIEVLPATMQQELAADFAGMREVLMAGRPERGRARTRVSAAVAHAIEFPTWHSLTRAHRLRNDEAVRLMAAMVEAAAG